VDNRFEVEQEEDEGGSTRQNWMGLRRLVCDLCSTGTVLLVSKQVSK